jgi:hypothetical protein
MGWASGSELMDTIIDAMMRACKSLTYRQRFYTRVIKAFQDHDWDCENECLDQDPAFDAALKAIWKKQGIEVDET